MSAASTQNVDRPAGPVHGLSRRQAVDVNLRSMNAPFVGSEALASGSLTRHELRTHHRRILPDVYIEKRATLTVEERTTAAWLWSKREGIVMGLAASAMLGSKWVDVDSAIELNWTNHRPPAGVLTRDETILHDELVHHGAMSATNAERTAFDLARRAPLSQAVARLDALARATHFKVDDVRVLGERHPRVKGRRQVDLALDLVDAGAESPQETRLRLMLIDDGFPRPQTQIPVLGPNGYPRYYLDMGWEDLKVAVEYDGRHHTERPVYTNDIVRLEYVNSLGWIVIRVVAEHRRVQIVQRVRRAYESRRLRV